MTEVVVRKPLAALVLALIAGGATACAGPVESAPPPVTSGSAHPGAEVPGQVLDLHNWYLTLPTGASGEPDTVLQPQLATYSSPFFQLDPTRSGVVLTSDAGGVTTKNSSYPRSELREMNGGERAAWSNRSGVHTLEIRQAVTALPPVKPEVVTAQIHDAEDDVLEIRAEDNRLLAAYDDGHGEFVIDPAYVLGTPYDLRIVAAAGRIDVFYNGAHAGGAALTGDGWYFKTGSYIQSNVSRGEAADAVGRVVLYGLAVTHSG
jgi:poly(beta-D-mannuronate) lyase